MLNFKYWYKEEKSDWFEEKGYTLFFKYKNEFYAGHEQDRITFAKLKTKDTKDVPSDKMYFTAINLNNKKNKKFEKKDINELEICEKEEAIKDVSI